MCKYFSDDLWAEFDKIEVWSELFREADRYLTCCRLDYRQTLSDPKYWFDIDKIVNLQGKVAAAEMQVNNLLASSPIQYMEIQSNE